MALLTNKMNLLIVDDEPEIRKTIIRYLSFQTEMDDVILHEAGSFSEALEKLESVHPLIILQDINLPDGNGLQLIRQVKSSYPVIQCVVITGASDLERVLDALSFGATDYLKKPLEMENLKTIVMHARERCERWGELIHQEYSEATRPQE
ncbi:MAG: response regulator [Magnetococcales bacterium]|nr:response regulator [Magnetococcales bacterium]